MAATFELIEIIGRDNLVKLQKALGPAMVYIPAEATIGHPISNAIGRAAMSMLCQTFGTSTIWIGTGYAAKRRNEELLQLRLQGIAAEDIAKRYGITSRWVRAVTEDQIAVHYGPKAREIQPQYGLRARRLRSTIQGLGEQIGDRGSDSRRKTCGDGAPHRAARAVASAD